MSVTLKISSNLLSINCEHTLIPCIASYLSLKDQFEFSLTCTEILPSIRKAIKEIVIDYKKALKNLGSSRSFNLRINNDVYKFVKLHEIFTVAKMTLSLAVYDNFLPNDGQISPSSLSIVEKVYDADSILLQAKKEMILDEVKILKQNIRSASRSMYLSDDEEEEEVNIYSYENGVLQVIQKAVDTDDLSFLVKVIKELNCDHRFTSVRNKISELMYACIIRNEPKHAITLSHGTMFEDHVFYDCFFEKCLNEGRVKEGLNFSHVLFASQMRSVSPSNFLSSTKEIFCEKITELLTNYPKETISALIDQLKDNKEDLTISSLLLAKEQNPSIVLAISESMAVVCGHDQEQIELGEGLFFGDVSELSIFETNLKRAEALSIVLENV